MEPDIKNFLNNDERLEFLSEKAFPFALTLDDGKFKIIDNTLNEIEDKKQKIKIYSKQSDNTIIKSFNTKEEREAGLYGVIGFEFLNCFGSMMPLPSDFFLNCESKGGKEVSKAKETKYYSIESLTTHFTAAIKKKDIHISETIENEIEKICFGNETKSLKEKLEDLENYLKKVGYLVPLKVTYGSRYTHFFKSNNEKAADLYLKEFKMSMGIKDKASLTNEKNKNDKKEFSQEISDLNTTSVGGGAGVENILDYKTSLNKVNYDAILYENLENILEFLSDSLKEKVYNFINEAREINGLIPFKRINNIQTLNLNDCNIKDINFLRNSPFIELKILDLSKNPEIKDYSPILSCYKLKQLILENNCLKDISFIQNFTLEELETIDLIGNTGITEFDPLNFLKKLKIVMLTKAPLSWVFNNPKILGELKAKGVKFLLMSEIEKL